MSRTGELRSPARYERSPAYVQLMPIPAMPGSLPLQCSMRLGLLCHASLLHDLV